MLALHHRVSQTSALPASACRPCRALQPTSLHLTHSGLPFQAHLSHHSLSSLTSEEWPQPFFTPLLELLWTAHLWVCLPLCKGFEQGQNHGLRNQTVWFPSWLCYL